MTAAGATDLREWNGLNEKIWRKQLSKLNQPSQLNSNQTFSQIENKLRLND